MRTEGLPDARARKRVAKPSSTSHLVSAGAGTGKTQLIVEKICNEFQSASLEPHQLVAITFTEAAAAEMRERIRAELVYRLRSGTVRPKERERIEEALERLESARICTIHSFAQAILSEFPLQAGVPVSFRVVEPSVYRARASERWGEFWRDLLEDDDFLALAAFCQGFGIDLRQKLGELALRAPSLCPQLLLPRRVTGSEVSCAIFPEERTRSRIASSAEDDRWVADVLWEVAEGYYFALPLAGLIRETALDDFVEVLSSCEPEAVFKKSGLSPLERCLASGRRLLGWAYDDPEPHSYYGAGKDFATLVESSESLPRHVRKAAESSQVAQVAEDLAELVAKLAEDVGTHCADAALALLARFVSSEAEERRSLGILTFEDLLTAAVELLSSRPDIRSRLQDRYRMVVIDEFQDTDPLQAYMAFQVLGLCASMDSFGDEATCVTSHDSHLTDLSSTRFVAVGDVKQSIYAFRGARPAILEELTGRWPQAVSHLQSNFRSRPEIVNFVNAVFGRAFESAGTEGGASPSYHPIEAVRAASEQARPRPRIPRRPRVLVIGGPEVLEGLPASEARYQEMHHVACLVEEALGLDGGTPWLVEKRDESGEPALVAPSLSDVAVLVRTRKWLDPLQEAFESHDIPYRLETGELLYAGQEAADILAVLKAVHDPADSTSVVAALKSQVFACTDLELYQYHRSAGETEFPWAYTRLDEAVQHSRGDGQKRVPAGGDHGPSYVKECLAYLEHLHGEATRLSPPRLLERLLRDRKLMESACSYDRRGRWRRYRLLLDDCRRFWDQEGGSLGDYIRWFETLSEGVGEDSYAGLLPAEPDHDAVRVLTIHGAKGLEFPIVFVVGAMGGDDQLRGDQLVSWPSCGIGLRLGPNQRAIRSSGYELAATAYEKELVRERVRLGYVAFTRARDYLVVSRYEKTRNADGGHLAAALEDALAEGKVGTGGSSKAAGNRPESYDLLYEWGTVRVEPAGECLTECTAEGARSATGDARPTASPKGAKSSDRLRKEAGHGSLVLQQLATEEALGLKPPVFSASWIAERLSPYDFETQGTRASHAHSAGLDPLVFGSAVHTLLSTTDLGADEDVRERVLQEAIKGIDLTGEADSEEEEARSLAIRLAKAALQLPSVARASVGRHWKELYVSAPGPEGTAVEGFADLVYETEAGLVVLDYKTDSLENAADRTSLLDRYSYQVAAYSWALERSTGQPVAGAVLAFLGDDPPVEHQVTDLEDRMLRIEKLLSELGTLREEALEAARNAATGPRAG